MWKCLLRRKGILPCQHAVTVHMLNPVVLPPALDLPGRRGSENTTQEEVTGEEEGFTFLHCVFPVSYRCDAIVISRDVEVNTSRRKYQITVILLVFIYLSIFVLFAACFLAFREHNKLHKYFII